MPELKPCPFCGNAETLIPQGPKGNPYDGWAIFCVMCMSYGPEQKTERKAIAAWNRRTPCPQS